MIIIWYCNGRRFANDRASLQRCTRETRQAAGATRYVDIDIVNCHPVILSWLLRQIIGTAYDIKTPMLDNYIVNRENLLAEIMETYDVSRDVAKKLPLVILNGGGVDIWRTENQVASTGARRQPLS